MTRFTRIAGAGLAALTGAAAAYTLTPFGDPDLAARPSPATSYDEAADRIASVRDAELRPPLHASGLSLAMLHGSATERAVVLFHGYTARPDQFRLIAKAYFEAGANVWVPRLPFHGELDSMTADLSKLTSQTLREYADAAIDIAAGLGRSVEIVGLSGGGSVALWAAVERAEVRRAVALSPLLKPIGYPAWSVMPLVRAYRLLPDRYRWWNEDAKSDLEWGGYPRYSYKGLAAFFGLVHWARLHGHRPDRSCPADGELVLVVNEGDQYIDGAYNRAFARALARPCTPAIVDIPAADGLLHNLVSIDGEVSDRIDLAYAWLERALGVTLPAPSQLET